MRLGTQRREAEPVTARPDSSPAGERRAYLEIEKLSKRFHGASTYALRDVSLSLAEGELLTLLGPSGCGKTTTLRCVAGLERPDSGSIAVRGVSVVEPGSRLFVPPEFRRIGMAFQSYALWPHMRVGQNVSYPLRTQRVAAEEARRRTNEILERVGLAHTVERFPRELSGGEQQRVALARAIVGNPDVLVLDEPLSNLDLRLRQQTLVWLVGLLRELHITSIYVTHDQSEALAISDRIAVMRAGSVQQLGSPEEIYERPATEFVARFVGSANILSGEVLEARAGECHVRVDADGSVHALQTDTADLRAGLRVTVVARPETMHHHLSRPDGGAIEATVRFRVYAGNGWQYVLAAGDDELGYTTGSLSPLVVGETVWFTLEPSRTPVIADRAVAQPEV